MLVEELRGHFHELANLAPVALRRQMDASRSQEGGSWPGAPISTAGLLGLPGGGSWNHMVSEWARMYARSSKDRHIVQALREHTGKSELWEHRDRWQKEVDGYEKAATKLYEWIVNQTEVERWKKIDPEHMDTIQRWLFGSVLIKTSGGEYEALEYRGRELTTHGGRDIVALGADTDKVLALRDWLVKLLEEAQGLREWADLKSATARMLEKQKKLVGIVDKIDAAIEGISLMRAFPGRCHLCPV